MGLHIPPLRSSSPSSGVSTCAVGLHENVVRSVLRIGRHYVHAYTWWISRYVEETRGRIRRRKISPSRSQHYVNWMERFAAGWWRRRLELVYIMNEILTIGGALTPRTVNGFN